MSFKFEKLIVWQKAADLSEKVSELVKKFPKDEMYILSSQFKRAADSISLDIAEGYTGQSNAEFSRFLGYALRSDIEVVGCLHLASGRKYISAEEFQELYNCCEELLVMINALRRTLTRE
ncbi:MAG: four helix bundle protein [Cyclobacteriaceae bacterium]|nr:four helix bundle protein [Cyclobacteriaceae bacterium]